MSMPCPTESEIRAFVTTDGDGPGHDALVRHFLDCHACQAVMDRMSPPLPAPDGNGPIVSPEIGRQILRGVRGALATDGSLADGRFRIVRALGVGGMGEVFEAVDTRLDRRVALKTVRAERFSPDALHRLETEARALAALDHPGIVRVHEWGGQPGLPYLAMEFVDGQTLSARLRRGPMAPVDAARLTRWLAQALGHAHQAGILHRDIKPSNIVLEPATDPAAPGALPDSGEGKSWRPRLIDFGLTKRLDTGVDYSRPGSPLGTPVYMPPEQVENRQDQIGPRSDLYTLGAVLYHCLTGQPPFPSDSEANTLQMVRQVDPPNPRLFNRGIPRDLETICLKCLCKQPAGRYATAADLAADLGRFLEGRPILARPAGRVERLWGWARRNRKLATALAGLALALLVLVGVLGVYGWREARLHRLAEEEAARANALLEENVRVYARSANELALAASSLAQSPRPVQDPRILGRYQKLQAAYSRMLGDFAGNPGLADRFPETLAEMYYHQARMSEDLGDRAGAIVSDKQMLAVLETVENPRDGSLERELSVAIKLATEAAVGKRPDEAVGLLRKVWDNRRQLAAGRFQPGTPQWLLMENIPMILSGVLANELKDHQAAETVQRQLAELREKVEAKGKGPR